MLSKKQRVVAIVILLGGLAWYALDITGETPLENVHRTELPSAPGQSVLQNRRTFPKDEPANDTVDPSFAIGSPPVVEFPVPNYHPRPAGEWEGMLVDLTIRAPCAESGICSMALACREDGRCGPCITDDHCIAGERCVLDRCLSGSSVECVKNADCPDHHACVLSGLGTGERNNEGMRAYCLDLTDGEPQEAERYPVEAFVGGVTPSKRLREGGCQEICVN